MAEEIIEITSVDHVIYEESGICITRSIIQIGNVSYPVNGINSIDVRNNTSGFRVVVGIAFCLIGILLLLGGFGTINGSSMQLMLFGGIFSTLGTLTIINSKVVELVLMTASRDGSVIISDKRLRLVMLKEHMERAVMLCGQSQTMSSALLSNHAHAFSEEKICARCAETVKAAALVCRYCGYEFIA